MDVTPQIRILVVDDYREAADMLVEVFITLGFDARAAYDGQHALSTTKIFQPDTVFLDIEMPDIDGFAVATRIRAMPDIPQPKLVALTGLDDVATKLHAQQVGFDAHVRKPAETDKLLDLAGFEPSQGLPGDSSPTNAIPSINGSALH
jgi:CheY-like chemotaxis protein